MVTGGTFVSEAQFRKHPAVTQEKVLQKTVPRTDPSEPMNTETTSVNTTAKWRHTMAGSHMYRGGSVFPHGIHHVTLGATYAKSFTPTFKGRPTRRGSPPH